MLGFATDRGAIFAIQGDVKDARPELLRHLGLQLQAFAHPHFYATVVVAHWQMHSARLGA
jgi:hypothetical protein